jgi:hypothetical protein
MASAAVRQAAGGVSRDSRDILVFFPLPDGPLPEPVRNIMYQIAARVWPWQRVIMLDDSIRFVLDQSAKCVEALREQLGLEDIDEIWLGSLWGHVDKIAAEAYPDVSLVLYEDGLHTYLPIDDHHTSLWRWLKEPRISYRALKHRVNELRMPGNLAVAPMLTRHLSRVSASFLWISHMLEPAGYQKRLPWVQLDTRYVRGIIEDIAPLVADVVEPAPETAPRRAIVLGQCFSNYGDFPRETELYWYMDLLQRLRKMGYDVIWKEHPRTRQPFFEELASLVEGVDSSPDLGPWPVELFVERLRLSACAALTSTSLYSIPLLYGVPSYSTAGRYLSALKFPNDVLTRLVADSIESMGGDGVVIPPSADGGYERRVYEDRGHERSLDDSARNGASAARLT